MFIIITHEIPFQSYIVFKLMIVYFRSHISGSLVFLLPIKRYIRVLARKLIVVWTTLCRFEADNILSKTILVL